MKVVINNCYGGFCLSGEAIDAIFFRKTGKHVVWYYSTGNGTMDDLSYTRANTLEEAEERTGRELIFRPKAFPEDVGNHIGRENSDVWEKEINYWDISRDDPDLIAAITQLGEKAKLRMSKFKIEEIPDGSFWKISDYDGMETLYWSSTKIHIA